MYQFGFHSWTQSKWDRSCLAELGLLACFRCRHALKDFMLIAPIALAYLDRSVSMYSGLVLVDYDILWLTGLNCSFVPSVHGWRKECLVSAVCACVKLTSFHCSIFCIMMQPFILFPHIIAQHYGVKITTQSFLHGFQPLYPLSV